MTKAIQEQANLVPVTFQLPNLTLRGFSFGNPQGEVVLCLHGWLDNAASFTPLLTAIAATQQTNNKASDNTLLDKHYVCLDWVGHGLSDHRSGDAHYHFLDYVYDLLQLFELNQWQKIHVLAHSMGGMVASAFVAAFPEKAKTLTLIDTLGFITAEPEDTTTQLQKGLLSRLKISNHKKLATSKTLNSAEINKKSTRAFPLETAIKARMNVSDLSFVHAKLLIERSITPVDDGYFWRTDKRLRTVSPYRYTFAQTKQLLTDISIPVMVVYGSKGLKQVTIVLRKLPDCVAAFRAEMLTGGHHVHMEQPEELANLLTSFWKANNKKDK
ncbi:alpha/beta fold hydrolase [Litorilituus lipolyticus]|uniref:Alpha/beta hydrolase n=1 Tax=Litorilituus lipolyticus TaxID=2491017 RepID=A0A502L4X8_9GAMM|nr:alpha/beta hydrolase [Litorilituus lipolyticus]TPH18980.1 alpha/beta hydrolase [Litorilituus lipolyticus]